MLKNHATTEMRETQIKAEEYGCKSKIYYTL